MKVIKLFDLDALEVKSLADNIERLLVESLRLEKERQILRTDRVGLRKKLCKKYQVSDDSVFSDDGLYLVTLDDKY